MTLGACQELRLPIGRVRVSTVEQAVRQAHALRRAWEIHTIDLSKAEVTDATVVGLAGCATLHTLNLAGCHHVT